MNNTRHPAPDNPEREDAIINAAPVQPGTEPRWASLFTRMLLPTMLFAMSMMGILPSSAKADQVNGKGSWQNDARGNARNGNDRQRARVVEWRDLARPQRSRRNGAATTTGTGIATTGRA